MSLVNTQTRILQARYSQSNLDWVEHRMSQYGAFRMALEDTASPDPLLTPGLIADAKRSSGIGIQIPVLNNMDIAITTTQSCTFPTFEGTSDYVTVNWNAYSWGFSQVPAEHFSNDISYRESLEKKIKSADRKFMETIDTLVITTALANTSPALSTSFVGVGAKYGDYATNGFLQVQTADRSTFLNDLAAIMLRDDFEGPYNIVSSTEYRTETLFHGSQGTANSTNTAFQYTDIWRFYNSNRFVPGAGNEFELFASPQGTWSIFNRNRLIHENGGYTTTTGVQYNLTSMLTVDWEVSTMYKSDCSNQSAIHGGNKEELQATPLEQWQFFTEVAIVLPYVETPASDVYPIVKAEFLA